MAKSTVNPGTNGLEIDFPGNVASRPQRVESKSQAALSSDSGVSSGASPWNRPYSFILR